MQPPAIRFFRSGSSAPQMKSTYSLSEQFPYARASRSGYGGEVMIAEIWYP